MSWNKWLAELLCSTGLQSRSHCHWLLVMFVADFADNKNFEPVHSSEWVWRKSSYQLYPQDSGETEFSTRCDTDPSYGHQVRLCRELSIQSVSCSTRNSNYSNSVGSRLSQAIVTLFILLQLLSLHYLVVCYGRSSIWQNVVMIFKQYCKSSITVLLRFIYMQWWW